MPTVHRLTALLTERGWLDRDPATRRLRLGLHVAGLVPALSAGLRLPELARPHLQALAAELHESVNAAILDGSEIVYLRSAGSDRLLSSQVTVGMRLPAHCTALGKCLLAQLPEELARTALGLEPYERRSPKTLTTWAELAASLARIRAERVAVSEGEYEIGLDSIAVPVRSIDGPGTAAINVSLPAARATRPVRAQVIRRLRETADAIDAAMAGPGGAA
jgi:DNA-binding IclR family transcriptional regulator